MAKRTTIPLGLQIAGKQREASSTIDVLDPSTEELFACVASAEVSDAIDAVTAASESMPAWAASPPRHRAEVLRRAYEMMVARRTELAELIVRENGKTLADAAAEVDYAAEFFRWYSEEAVRAFADIGTSPSGANRILVLRQPVGVSVLVTPWNFPAAMVTRKIGPALAAGNSVVLKPASATPLTALRIGDILAEAGAPAGTVNIVPSRKSSAVVSAMLHDARVRKLSFTGSTEVGRALLHEAADNVVNVSMELGGNAPFIVCEDADLVNAVNGAMIAKMRSGGEACTAANRFLVHRSIAAEFADMLSERMAALRVGPGLDSNVDVGPLVDRASRDKVEHLVDAATDAGARVRTGGSAPARRGFFYLPTVLDRVEEGSPILNEEIFGPVAPIMTFDDDEEAVRLANDTEYGLMAYVYSHDLRRGLRIVEALESGMVGLNRGIVSDAAAPFGGVKQSGIGREGGHEGLLDYLESKYIATAW
jgi:succinate-semialdehyde dehydrogenase/glutarate-semialdehyde dehydrogenase